MSIYVIFWKTEECPAQVCLHVFFLKAREYWLEQAREVLRLPTPVKFLGLSCTAGERRPEAYPTPALLPLPPTLWSRQKV